MFFLFLLEFKPVLKKFIFRSERGSWAKVASNLYSQLRRLLKLAMKYGA
jgi:hypothetical protein